MYDASEPSWSNSHIMIFIWQLCLLVIFCLCFVLKPKMLDPIGAHRNFSFIETQISSYHFFNFALPLFLSFLPIALLDWWSRGRKREIVSLVFGLTFIVKSEPGTCLHARVRRGKVLLRLQGNVPLDPRQARGPPYVMKKTLRREPQFFLLFLFLFKKKKNCRSLL